jgi:hypothetical protein
MHDVPVNRTIASCASKDWRQAGKRGSSGAQWQQSFQQIPGFISRSEQLTHSIASISMRGIGIVVLRLQGCGDDGDVDAETNSPRGGDDLDQN